MWARLLLDDDDDNDDDDDDDGDDGDDDDTVIDAAAGEVIGRFLRLTGPWSATGSGGGLIISARLNP